MYNSKQLAKPSQGHWKSPSIAIMVGLEGPLLGNAQVLGLRITQLGQGNTEMFQMCGSDGLIQLQAEGLIVVEITDIIKNASVRWNHSATYISASVERCKNVFMRIKVQ